uniref:Putative ixodes 14 kDa protein n=1 Tax=Ixodes ricinus TaxID=34613 RepID=A0A0K8RIS0_IXORI
MNIYLATVAGLLAVIFFIPDAKISVSSEASGESESTDDSRQPLLCGASSDDQKKIVKCIQANETVIIFDKYRLTFLQSIFADVKQNVNCTHYVFPKAKRSLQNYTWIFENSSDVVVTNICNKSNEVFVGMSEDESESLFNHTLQCEDTLGVTTTTTAPTTSSEVEDSKSDA